MELINLESLFSIIVSIAAVAVPIVAKKAMEKGLTYSAMTATVWTLNILAIARVWHTIYDVFNLKAKYGEPAEFIEYTIYLIAYFVFIWLVYRSTKARTPAPKIPA
ncbi:hypothetical protein HZC33_01775 [Candidatus Wolfebacteria bacterium]|nr:hypothetical protein [Candidatus Wolfebacteria bacterium]